jgi:hypothetical protein
MKNNLLIIILLAFCLNVFSEQSDLLLLPVKINHKWGYIDRAGKIVIQPSYDHAYPYICKLAITKKSGKFGVINLEGKSIFNNDKDAIEIHCPSYIGFKKDTLWGLSDDTGKILLDDKYDKIGTIQHHIFTLNKNNLVGLYESNNAKKIDPEFTSVQSIGNNLIKVVKSQKIGLINSDLTWVIRPECNFIESINDSMAFYRQKDYFGIVYYDGTILLRQEYTSYKILNKNLISLKSLKGGNALFSIPLRKIISTENQDSYTLLNDDLIMLNKAHKHGIISSGGRPILPQIYSNIHINDGLLLIEQNTKWGLAELNGKIIIETVHDKLFPFKKNLAVFQTSTGKGVINNKGKILAKPIYNNVDFTESHVKCSNTNGTYFIVKFDALTSSITAAKITKKVEVIKSFNHNHAWLKGPSKRWGLIGHDTIFVPYKFDEVSEENPDFSLGFQKMDYRQNPKMYGYINQQKLNEKAVYKVSLIQKSDGKSLTQQPVWYVRTKDFTTGNAAMTVLEGGMQGLITKEGKLISEYISTSKDKKITRMPLQYIGPFVNGVASYCTGCSLNYAGDWESNKAEGGKWGFISDNGSFIMEPQFESATDMVNNRAIVKYKNLYGLVSSVGNFILKNDYQSLAVVTNSGGNFIEIGYQKDRFGLIDDEGKALTEIIYDKIYPYKESYARVMLNGKYGFLDLNGKIVIPAIYTEANDFSEGMALVSKDKERSYLSRNGTSVIVPSESLPGDFHNGLAFSVRDGNVCYIDKTGKIALQTNYKAGSDFHHGYAVVISKQSGLEGIIDVTGKIVAPLEFQSIEPTDLPHIFKVNFENEKKIFNLKIGKPLPKKAAKSIGNFIQGIAAINLGEYHNYIDTTGKLLISKKFNFGADFSQGLARVKTENGKFGFINTLGAIVLPAIYSNATDFSEGKAFVETPSKKYALIDMNAVYLTHAIFDNPQTFKSGYALVQSSSQKKYYFVDKDGKNSFLDSYDMAYSFEGNVARVSNQKKWGLVDITGDLLIDFKFDFMEQFTNKQTVVGLSNAKSLIDLDGNKITDGIYDSYKFIDPSLVRFERADALGYYNTQTKNWIWSIQR